MKIARSVEELLADETIRLVVVATGNNTHFELARQCLAAGRHVVIDKPFTVTSAEAAELIALARERDLLLSAYQNRRWDGDFKTVRKLLASEAGNFPEAPSQLGRLIVFESHFDRFREEPRLQTWKESGALGGGILYDLGPHLIDQALTLFGTPETITADIRIDREGGVTDDAFDIRLSYPRLTVLLRSTMTATIPGPRFTLHGTGGSYVKFGLDPQEDAIKNGAKIGAPGWGEEPESAWALSGWPTAAKNTPLRRPATTALTTKMSATHYSASLRLPSPPSMHGAPLASSSSLARAARKEEHFPANWGSCRRSAPEKESKLFLPAPAALIWCPCSLPA